MKLALAGIFALTALFVPDNSNAQTTVTRLRAACQSARRVSDGQGSGAADAVAAGVCSGFMRATIDSLNEATVDASGEKAMVVTYKHSPVSPEQVTLAFLKFIEDNPKYLSDTVLPARDVVLLALVQSQLAERDTFPVSDLVLCSH